MKTPSNAPERALASPLRLVGRTIGYALLGATLAASLVVLAALAWLTAGPALVELGIRMAGR